MKLSKVTCPNTGEEFDVRRYYDKGDEYEIDVYIGCSFTEYVKGLGCVLSFEDSEEIIVLDIDGSFSFRTTKEENEEVFNLCTKESREHVAVNGPRGIFLKVKSRKLNKSDKPNVYEIYRSCDRISLREDIIPGKTQQTIIEILSPQMTFNLIMANTYMFDNFTIVCSYSESPYVVVIRKKVDDFK